MLSQRGVVVVGLVPVLASIMMFAACGSDTPPAAGPTSASAAPTTTTSATTAAPTTTTSSKYSHQQQLFLQKMHDKGVLTTSASTDEALALSQADLYCRMLAEGWSRQKIFAGAGLPGSAARTRTELIFFDGVVALCPQHSALATR